MKNVTDFNLESLSVRELMELQDAIKLAVRGILRQQNERRAAPVTAASRPLAVDLERERDAWLARKNAR